MAYTGYNSCKGGEYSIEDLYLWGPRGSIVRGYLDKDSKGEKGIREEDKDRGRILFIV